MECLAFIKWRHIRVGFPNQVHTRRSQTKLFGNNFSNYQKLAPGILTIWCEEAQRHFTKNNDCDLHIHMISTVPSAENVYAGREDVYEHLDELWIWIPRKEQAEQHLKSFLSAFQSSPQIVNSIIQVEFLGENTKELEQIFGESFRLARKKETDFCKTPVPVAVLRYKAGLLNSRKAMISPYLPKLIK